MKKLRLVSTNLKSTSLKRIADQLTTLVKYKVWRSHAPKMSRNNLRYGDQKDKLYQYRWFKEQGLPSLEFTTSKDEAQTWLTEESPVVVRHLLRASEGKGIEIAEVGRTLPDAPCYTRYKKKKKEFRIHIFKDKVVHVLEKRKKVGYVGGTHYVRNLANGFVFCSDNVVEPDGLRELALAAGCVTSSDFKGVDIGYNEKKNELFVIEVNSAPGIEGTNVQRYCDVILK